MKTSCFFTYGNNKGAVGIALRSPKFFTKEEYFDLAPTPEILSNWRRYKNKKKYKKQYKKQVLSKLDPQKVYDDLKNKTLLCWELPGEFCHRRLVAKWLEKELGIKVKEIKQ